MSKLSLGLVCAISAAAGMAIGFSASRTIHLSHSVTELSASDHAHRVAAAVEVLALQSLAKGDVHGATQVLDTQLTFDLAGLAPGYTAPPESADVVHCQLESIAHYLAKHPRQPDGSRPTAAALQFEATLPSVDPHFAEVGCAQVRM